jgi:hypothetical protein
MVLGAVFSLPSLGGASETAKAWFIELIPLGGLVSDIASGRVDGRQRLLSWHGWSAVALLIAIALGLVFWPGFLLWAGR